jgi:hypothetical protein
MRRRLFPETNIVDIASCTIIARNCCFDKNLAKLTSANDAKQVGSTNVGKLTNTITSSRDGYIQ